MTNNSLTQSEFILLFPGTRFRYIHDVSKKVIQGNDTLDLSLNEKGHGVFFTVNGFPPSGKATIEQLMSLNGNFVDIDLDPNLSQDEIDATIREIIMSCIDEGMSPPTIINRTKKGVHLIWLYPESIAPTPENLEKWKDVQQRLVHSFKGDTACTDPTRVLRVPYTLHLKDPENPFEIKIQSYKPDSKYTLNELDATTPKSSEENSDKKWLKGKNGVAEGSRNDTAASMAGKILRSMDSKLWEDLGWEQLKIWNGKNSKLLPNEELRTVWESIKKYQTSNATTNNQLQAKNLIESITTRDDVVLFHDDKRNGYVSFEVDNHRESWPCKSRDVKRWLSNGVWQKHKKPITSEMMKNILSVLEANACYEGAEHKLHNRTAWLDGDLWYDLANSEWQAIRVTSDSWSLIDKPPILFKRYNHHKSQVTPKKNGDPKLFLKYVNVNNEQQKLLLMVFLVSCFVPGFPHPLLVVFGSHGSAKSTQSKLLRLVIDPSVIDVVSLPDSHKELIQILAHHNFLFLDNVSYLSDSQSDDLCKAITGSGFSKRELYENDEDIIYNLMNCIGINGINLMATKADLLDRALLVELERIDDSDKKIEEEIYSAFQEDLPSILGGVFDVLVKAKNIRPTIQVDRLPRMADFALWGCAIAEAMGYTKEEFLSAYQINITRQTEMLLSENIVAAALVVFMKDKDEWKGTSTHLLGELNHHANIAGIDTFEKYWPKSSNALSRKLNELSTPLKQMGYSVVINTTGAERFVHVKRVEKNKSCQTPTSATLLQLPLDETDGTDDIPR